MFKVEFFTEDEYDGVGSIQTESLSEASSKIQEIEKESGMVIDYAKLQEADQSFWYMIEDDYTFTEADQEVSQSLEEDFGDDIDNLISESGWFEELLAEESEELDEQLKRRVSSSGKVTRKKSRKVRSRRATRTTGMSKSALKRRGRKSAKTRKRDVGGTKRATKKRKRAMRKRRSMGVR